MQKTEGMIFESTRLGFETSNILPLCTVSVKTLSPMLCIVADNALKIFWKRLFPQKTVSRVKTKTAWI